MFTFTLAMSLWMGVVAPILAPATSPLPKAAPTVSNTEAVIVEKVSWSADRRLTWEDFKGRPDETNGHHALTAANLAVDARCSSNKVSYDVKCVFLPQQSWSRNKKSEKLLKHEQLHFDLTEVHARQLRKKLNSLGASCTNLQENLNVAVKNAFKEWKEEQALFDKDSSHGLNRNEEEVWAAHISKRLSGLQAYR
ncbi:DUF922 domain-containing protein [Pontibacter locisalis]|uniref:DUF922 domain-containing protein n=1 Tax=Pontibacter locisalis TaxID=1719035 RepID=A0ABW5IGW7_9BACT